MVAPPDRQGAALRSQIFFLGVLEQEAAVATDEVGDAVLMFALDFARSCRGPSSFSMRALLPLPIEMEQGQTRLHRNVDGISLSVYRKGRVSSSLFPIGGLSHEERTV